MPPDCLRAAEATRRLPRPSPPALPDGWRLEAGMYVSPEGDSIEAELVDEPHAQAYMLRYHARRAALWQWASQRQALAALVARQEQARAGEGARS